ncbi:energy transducer TonB [Oleiharenicola sp. Vm1]|uniref:energy transducer TonB n=1 Tax=Oleiharenicola sp. Vm1 TaxID=3398393 RepID=UPI0039F63241
MKTPRILASLSLAAALASPVSAAPPPESPVSLRDIDYPAQLIRRGITSGEVRVLLKIGPDARLQDALVTAYTNKAFADATLAALPQGTFRPQKVEGQPVTTVAQLTVRFEVSGLVVVERYANDGPELPPGVFAYQPCNPERLDRPLQLLSGPTPVYPISLREQGVHGRVVLEYYVDEAGRVRMPVVSETENELLSSLSIQAVEQWQFSPPSSRGQPVLVHVRQTFLFGAEKTG